jgi:hypothetical protein
MQESVCVTYEDTNLKIYERQFIKLRKSTPALILFLEKAE